LVVLGVVVSLALVACGGSKEEAKHAQVKPGNMPEGGEWTGVYYSTLYGHLHLIKEDTTISGRWRTANGDKWGEMNGTVTGDLFTYEWQEHTIGVVGPSATTSGHGYFRYVIPAGENVEHEIRGEWGLGASNAGQKWTAIKQRNVQPDPDSVMPDEFQSHQEVDEWDEKPGGKKAPPPSSTEGSGDDSSSGDDWD
jgi:hypothetical protein